MSSVRVHTRAPIVLSSGQCLCEVNLDMMVQMALTKWIESAMRNDT